MAVNKLLLTILIILVGLPLYADPSIITVSGTITNGSDVIITGANFGAKSTPAPVQWDNFDAGTVGTNVDGSAPVIGTTWTANLGTNPTVHITYSDEIQRGGSGNAALRDFWNQPGGTSGIVRQYTSDTYYVSAWVYYEDHNTYPVISTYNYKVLFIMGTNGGAPSSYWSYGDPTASMRIGMINETNGQPCGDHLSGSYPGIFIPADIQGKWVRYEAYWKQSTGGGHDGQMTCWLHLPTGITRTHNYTNICTRDTETYYWDRINFNEYHYPSVGAEARIFMDEAYVDNTLARVEIGNESTWAACTHREIQIPSAWAVGEITARVNRGSFAADAPAYVYVVDSNGVYNSTGYPITFGDIENDTAPSPFTFTDIVGASRSTQYTSDQITVADINATANVSITGGTYSKNGGTYTTSTGTCVVGDTFTVRHTSSASYNTATNTVLTIGGVSDTYTTTTLLQPPDVTPPTVIISTNPQSTDNSFITINWTDSDAVGITERKWWIGYAPDASQGITTDSATSTVIPDLSSGINNIFIGAGDASGNWGSDNVDITYIPTPKLYLTNPSGSGLTQTSPNASIGGYRSISELSKTGMKNLFDDVTTVEAILGDTEYRMIDVYNDGAYDLKKVQIFMKTPTSSPGTEIALGYSATDQPHANSWNGQVLTNENTAPASPVFTFANRTRGSPLSIGTIPAGQSVRVGVRRTVNALTPWTTNDLGVIGMRWIE